MYLPNNVMCNINSGKFAEELCLWINNVQKDIENTCKLPLDFVQMQCFSYLEFPMQNVKDDN